MATRPIIDFYYSGNNKYLAFKALRKIYPRYSLKRRIAYLCNALNLLLLRRVAQPCNFIKDILVGKFTPTVNGDVAILLHKIQQNGRVYIFNFDQSGGVKYVTKVALTSASQKGVMHEYEVLMRLTEITLPFQVPRVVHYSNSSEACALSVSATPENFISHDKSIGLPNFIIDAVASIRLKEYPSSLPRSAFGWFDAALRHVTNSAIISIAQQIAPSAQFKVCAAHCDLGSENVFSDAIIEPNSPQFMIIDWEYFTETAPAMTDRVAYWLGQHHRQFKREIGAWNSKVSTRHFLEAFSDTQGGKPAAILALLCLANMGNDLAERLCGVSR